MASAKPLHCSTVRKVSTSTASCSPWISVAELATHIRGSLPGGTSRFRPGRVTVNTLYLNGGVLLSELAIAAPGIIGSMTREASFIISRRFILTSYHLAAFTRRYGAETRQPRREIHRSPRRRPG